MNGIVALLRRDGRPAGSREPLRMLDALAHRGAVSSVATFGSAALGARAAARVAGADVADARIDNADEVARALGLATRPDPDRLIGRAFRAWGSACAERLRGDFAFVCWDATRRELVCARDCFGVRPLYYVDHPHYFACASEIKALLRLARVPPEPHEPRVADFLAGVDLDKEATFFKGIRRLPPASVLRAGPRGVTVTRYWRPDAEREERLSDAAAAERLGDLLQRAVDERLPAGGGALLSGGLDSSSLVCLARRRAPVKTVSAIFPGQPCDERPFIRAVVEGGGVEDHYVEGGRLSPLHDLDRCLDEQDQPFFAPNLFLHMGLYEQARRAGVEVLCDGLDGDTTVSHGLARLPELARGGRILALAREIDLLARRHGRTRRSIWRRHVVGALRPGRYRAAGFRAPLLDRAYVARTGVARRWAWSARALWSGHRTARAAHHAALERPVMVAALENADHAAARLGIEPTYPFFDRRVVEFCLALPADQKLRDGWTRLVLRRAMRGVLPDAVRWRAGKADLSPNFVRGMVARGPRLADELDAAAHALRGRVDEDAFWSVRERTLAGSADPATLLETWRCLLLAAWLRRHGFDQGVAS